jgi:hypothetical protein
MSSRRPINAFVIGRSNPKGSFDRLVRARIAHHVVAPENAHTGLGQELCAPTAAAGSKKSADGIKRKKKPGSRRRCRGGA